MALLTGLTSDGTEVPVQVDQQGRLVAEGLQGIQGIQGPQGPQGPQGDASNWTRTGTDMSPRNAGDSVMLGGTLPSAPAVHVSASGYVAVKRQIMFFQNLKNGGATRNTAIETISTDGGTNSPKTYCDERYGEGKYVLLAAFNSAGKAISSVENTGSGSTFVVCITDGATNFYT
jgi:hypothetical protein